MTKSDEVLQILRNLAKDNGKIISLEQIHKVLIKEGVFQSKKSVANCLRRLEMVRKIKPINFGVSVELLEQEKSENIEPIQNSFNGWKAKWFNG